MKAENLQMVEVYNLMGQKVMSSTTSEIDMSDLRQGIYSLRLVTDEKTITKCVIKQ